MATLSDGTFADAVEAARRGFARRGEPLPGRSNFWGGLDLLAEAMDHMADLGERLADAGPHEDIFELLVDLLTVQVFVALTAEGMAEGGGLTVRSGPSATPAAPDGPRAASAAVPATVTTVRRGRVVEVGGRLSAAQEAALHDRREEAADLVGTTTDPGQIARGIAALVGAHPDQIDVRVLQEEF